MKKFTMIKYLASVLLFLSFSAVLVAQRISFTIEDEGVLFKEGKDTILFYQTSEKDINGLYKRANYIHPLYTLDGEVLTEDFPEDHPHHRGILWAWHQLYVGNQRIGDGWLTKDFKWQLVSMEEYSALGNEKGITANLVWKSPLWLDTNGNETPLVSENTTIVAYPRTENFRLIDIQITLLANVPNLRIGGSEDEKGYGGFSTRIRLVENLKFTSALGQVKPDRLPIKADEWIDISGGLGYKGAGAGIAILCHPKNPGHPNPWILRPKNSMQNAVYPYPGAKAILLSNTSPTILRYRLLIHDGLKPSEISELYGQYEKML